MRNLTLFGVVTLILSTPTLAVTNAKVGRLDREKVTISWNDPGAVSVFVSDTPSANIAAAMQVTQEVRNGFVMVASDTKARHYFLLKGKDGKVVHVAERLLPLEQGSNFRDVGGYTGAGGKMVKWGKIFRSGAMPMLTQADYAQLLSLHIGSMIDLRSIDEREIAPTLLDDRTGALYIANDYSAKSMFASMPAQVDGKFSSDLYANFARDYAPQYRAIFNRLLADDGAVVYNCSAGQDRTGTATALIYSVLGVPRDVIMADYHLSTKYRRPQFEMPKINPADYPNNPIAAYYAAAAKRPGGAKAEPLYGADGVPFLKPFLEGLEARYGSIDAYLEKEIGLTPEKRAKLKALYLE